jgi:hypothetical protein
LVKTEICNCYWNCRFTFFSFHLFNFTLILLKTTSSNGTKKNERKSLNIEVRSNILYYYHVPEVFSERMFDIYKCTVRMHARVIIIFGNTIRRYGSLFSEGSSEIRFHQRIASICFLLLLVLDENSPMQTTISQHTI